MAKQPIPGFDGTIRQWKSMKRRELQALLKEFDVFRRGCAYTPIYPDPVEKVGDLLDEMKDQLSVTQWGR